MLRADFELWETYAYTDEDPLEIPLHGFAGEQDASVERSELEASRDHTRAPVDVRTFPGDHFYLAAESRAVAEAVFRALGVRNLP